MTVQLFEGCFGLTRGSDGVPQEVVGPMRKDPDYTYIWDCEGCYPDSGDYHWFEDGESGSSANDDCPPIIRTFPDRASAEAALAGSDQLPGGDALRDLWNAWEDAAHAQIDAIDPASVVRAREAFTAELVDGYVNGSLIPRPAEPAQAGVDWGQRRWEAMLAALTGIMADPRSLRFDAGKQSYDVAAEANAILAASIADALVAAAMAPVEGAKA